ncbi:MAG: 3-octaprenyl-4-hydroxybenzoate carboxy-lyase, partial [Alistipes sp.]|nr:3-octaprenyl-4-hydroxybenzoate carboxy-lyase [Alistipes sp.]
MKIIVAVTGASGALYARQTLECLLASHQVETIALIVSRSAEEVLRHEGIELPCDGRIRRFDNDDMTASVASGSAEWEAMIVVPASMGTVARIAAGVSHSLIESAADGMRKERRRRILV